MLTSSLTASSSSSPTALFPSSTSSSFTAPSPCSLSFPFLNASTRTPKTKWEKTSTLRIQASMSSSMIEKEVPEAQRPTTFLRETDENASSSSDSIRARFEKMIREAQDSVCSAIELADGSGKFKEDVWSRHGGGGGINRVLQDGAVFEKSGVNVSVVYGVMPPEAYRAAKPSENGDVKPGPIPFFAVGISSVLHPKNPFAPTLHFNYRYFETDAPKEAPGAPKQWWFGGGPKGCL